jgi:hypothetical protein
MKKAIIPLLLVLLIGCGGISPVVRTHQDDVKGVRYRELAIPFNPFYTQEIIFRNSPSEKYIIFNLHTNDWFFIERAYFLIDGDRVVLKPVHNDREVYSGDHVQEWIVFESSKHFWRRLARANTVRFVFSGDRDYPGELTQKHKEALLSFAQ